MNIHPEAVQKAINGDDRSLFEVLDAHLAHLHAIADLITVASEQPDALVEGSLRNAAWFMETKAEEARTIQNNWFENHNRDGKEAQA